MGISIGPWQIGGGSGGSSQRRGQSCAGTGASARFAWWSGLSRAERITTLSILVGGVVAIVASVAWALALSYIAHQNARAALMEDELYSIEAGELPEGLADQGFADQGLAGEENTTTSGGWRR